VTFIPIRRGVPTTFSGAVSIGIASELTPLIRIALNGGAVAEDGGAGGAA
jgi:hypothetical protein